MDSNDSNLRFRPRFSVRTLLVVVTLVCVGLGWSIYSHRANYRQVCDQELDRVLTATHWKADSGGQPAQFLQYWADDFGSQASCNTSVLRLDGTFADGTTPDQSEQQLLNEWSKNAIPASGAPSEHAEQNSWLGTTFVYYKAIRAKTSCVACHSTLNASKAAANGNLPAAPLKVGDLIAIGRVQLAK